jgi:hypothetical protein
MKRTSFALLFPLEDSSVQLLNTSKLAAGNLFSYGYTGAAYTAEVLWDVAGGTVMFVGLCSLPILAHTPVLISENGKTFPYCFPGKFNALQAPPLGRTAWEQTKDLRCPDLDSLSKSLRQVASCFSSQNTKESVAKAAKTLSSLKENPQAASCLSADERRALDQQWEQTTLQRASLSL